MTSISLGGIVYGANGRMGLLEIQRRPTKVGTPLVADDGTRNFVFRSMKGVWTLPFAGIPEAYRNHLYALYAGGTFTFVDQGGTPYTVQCEDGDYDEKASPLMDGRLTYDVGLTIREA